MVLDLDFVCPRVCHLFNLMKNGIRHINLTIVRLFYSKVYYINIQIFLVVPHTIHSSCLQVSKNDGSFDMTDNDANNLSVLNIANPEL